MSEKDKRILRLPITDPEGKLSQDQIQKLADLYTQNCSEVMAKLERGEITSEEMMENLAMGLDFAKIAVRDVE